MKTFSRIFFPPQVFAIGVNVCIGQAEGWRDLRDNPRDLIGSVGKRVTEICQVPESLIVDGIKVSWAGALACLGNN